MNVIIAGEDVVGFRIAEELMASHRVVCVASEDVNATRFERLDVELVLGPATSPEVLRRAHIDKTDFFVACTSSDERNIVACIAAQRLGAQRTICVLTSPGFLSVVDDDMALAESLGIDAVVRPSEQLSEEILRIVTVPGALDVQELVDGRVRLLRYAVEQGAPITRAPLHALKLPRHVVLIMVRRGEEAFIPKGDTHIEAGDKLTAMGRWTAVRHLLFRFLHNPDQGTERRRATVVGGGTVGFSVVKGLEEAGFRVKLIETNRRRCEELAGDLNSLVLHGDGADLDLLEQERIGDSPVLVAVADNDEKNLLVSLLAKQLGVKRTVTRANRLANELMFEKVGVDVVRSAKGAAIRSVVRTIDRARLEIQAELEHGDACVLELTLPERFGAVALKDLHIPTKARVGSIVRGRRLVIPAGDDDLRAGDHVLVFCMREDEAATRQFFLEPGDAENAPRVRA